MQQLVSEHINFVYNKYKDTDQIIFFQNVKDQGWGKNWRSLAIFFANIEQTKTFIIHIADAIIMTSDDSIFMEHDETEKSHKREPNWASHPPEFDQVTLGEHTQGLTMGPSAGD